MSQSNIPICPFIKDSCTNKCMFHEDNIMKSISQRCIIKNATISILEEVKMKRLSEEKLNKETDEIIRRMHESYPSLLNK